MLSPPPLQPFATWLSPTAKGKGVLCIAALPIGRVDFIALRSPRWFMDSLRFGLDRNR